jgi:hypothetical protein
MEELWRASAALGPAVPPFRCLGIRFMTTLPRDEDLLALIEILHTGRSKARRGAARVLGQVRPVAEPIVTALVTALADRDAFVRLAAAQALQGIGAEAVPALIRAWGGADADYRNALAATVGMLGPCAKQAIPLLTKALEDGALRQSAADALARIRGGRLIAWDRALERTGPWVFAAVAVLALGNEVLSWIGVFSRAEGLALRIAVAWAVVGAGLGAMVGVSLRLRRGVRLGIKALGIGGAYAGLVVGGLVGPVVEPLVRVLGGR